MSEPIYGPAFEQLWDRLPDVYQRADAKNNWQFKRYLAGVGTQFSDLMDMVDRFSYVPPQDRELLHVTPPPSGDQFAFDTSHLIPYDAQHWTLDTSGSEPTWDLSTTLTAADDDGMSMLLDEYLPAGTYYLTFRYNTNRSVNGVVSVSVNGTVIATPALKYTAGGSFVDSAPISFTIDRGYNQIRFAFDQTLQADNTKRINVGAVKVVNMAAGYEYSTSDLVNPYSADPAWLPWLALLVGVKLDQNLSVADQRASIIDGYSGMNAGTKDSIARAVAPYLTGTRSVTVFDHSTAAAGGIGAGGQFDILVVTRATETPADLDINAVVVAAGAKPAGVILHQRSFTATWDAIAAADPYWQNWDANTWTSLEETGLGA